MICDSTATDDDATEDEEEKEIAGVRCQSHEEEEESVAKRWGKQHSPLEHLYSKDTSIQGTQNWVPKKCSHNLCILYLYCSDTSIQGKGHFFWITKPGFTFHSGDTLEINEWLATKIVNTFVFTGHNGDSIQNMN